MDMESGRQRRQSAQATFVISVAAELAGMHPQTLRQYDRLGLVSPARTKGRGRRYTSRDIQRLRDVQRMSKEEGINLAGIHRILELERRVEHLESERDRMRLRLDEVTMRENRVFAASPTGEVSPVRRGERPWAPAAVRDGESLVPVDRWRGPGLGAMVALAEALGLTGASRHRPAIESGSAASVIRVVEGKSLSEDVLRRS